MSMKVIKNAKGYRIIAQEVLSAKERAKAIIQQAKDSAALVNAEAESRFEQAFQESQVRGFEEGQAQATQLLASLMREQKKLLDGQEDDLVALAISVARKICAAELHIAPERIQDIVHAALQSCDESEALLIRVAVDVALPLKNAVAKSGVNAVVQADVNLLAGDCIIESSAGVIDARLETKFQALIDDFAKADG